MFGKRSLANRIVGVGACFLIALPVVAAFLYVERFGVNVVLRDQWVQVPYFAGLHAGTLELLSFWPNHNEHRIVFPRLAMLALGTLTDYNNVAEMYLILLCFLVTLVCLFVVFRHGSGARFSLLAVLFVPVAFLVFSLRQYENMLWGFQIAFAFAQMFSVLTFLFLYFSGRNRKVAFVAALMSGAVASFSAAQGLLVWPVGLLQLLISPLGRVAKGTMAGVWSLSGAGIWFVYFRDLQTAGQGPSPFEVFFRPAASIEFFMTALGSSLFGRPDVALLGGSLLAVLGAVSLLLLYRCGKAGENTFWVALLLYAGLVAASITAGRSASELGVLQALPSKYTTFSLLAVAAIYAILVRLVFDGRSYIVAASLCVLVLLVLSSVPLSYSKGIEAGRVLETRREEAALILHTYENQPDENLENLFRDPDMVRQRAETLERLDYNVFAEGPPDGAARQSDSPPG